MATIVIIKQEAINLDHLIKEIIAEGHTPRVIDANKIRDCFISENDEIHSASSLFHSNIKRNAIKCGSCGDIIESLYTDHSIRCECGLAQIDGGHTKLIRNISGPFKELAEFYLPTI